MSISSTNSASTTKTLEWPGSDLKFDAVYPENFKPRTDSQMKSDFIKADQQGGKFDGLLSREEAAKAGLPFADNLDVDGYMSFKEFDGIGWSANSAAGGNPTQASADANGVAFMDYDGNGVMSLHEKDFGELSNGQATITEDSARAHFTFYTRDLGSSYGQDLYSTFDTHGKDLVGLDYQGYLNHLQGSQG